MHFFMRLIPPRTTFVQDMTPEEEALMMAHADYLKLFFDEGKLLAYGPVLAEAGPFGIGLFDVASAEEAHTIMRGDPTIQAGLNRYEISPMRITGARAPKG